MNLYKRVNTGVYPTQVLREIFEKIKAVNLTAMSVLVRNQGQETNYIKEVVYIPNGKN